MDDILASEALAALGNRTRLHLFRLLVRAGDDGMLVGEIQRHLGIPASTLAHHVSALARTDLIRQERSGREVRCFAKFDGMRDLIAFLTEDCCCGVPLVDDDKAA